MVYKSETEDALAGTPICAIVLSQARLASFCGYAMKYLVILLFILAAWTLFDQLVLKGRASGEGRPLIEEVKEFGRNFHVMAGILAAVVLIVLLLRLIYHSLWAH
ncbi:MAG: hypothetical protein FJY85_14700 [Deltaproteobacteria bacterium]|nr:hypothetical protein [Deltaproteobacteria bacterium]